MEKVRVNFMIKSETYEQLRAAADRSQIPMSRLVDSAIQSYLERSDVSEDNIDGRLRRLENIILSKGNARPLTLGEIEALIDAARNQEHLPISGPVRPEGESFGEFVQKGADALIRENPEIVERLL